MPVVNVTAQSFNPDTGLPTASARTEAINLQTNVIFRKCKTLTDIAEAYMKHWNRFPTIQTEMILVQSISWVVPEGWKCVEPTEGDAS